VVKGTVTNVTDFGVFLEIEKGVEGLIHVSEISKDKVDNLKEFAKLGDDLEVLIISIDRRSRKIGLSIRDLKEVEDQRDLQEYIAREEQASAATLGDVFKGDLLQNTVKEEPVEAPLQEASAAPAEDAAAEAPADAPPEEYKNPLSAYDESPVADESGDTSAEHKEE
jgi:predicted RNA-binding protein with RPS1 domain